MRLSIRVDPWWRPLLVPFGVTASRSYVDVDERFVHVRFGFFQHRFPRTSIVAATLVRHNWLYKLACGIGWHTNFVDRLVVNGSLAGLVELQLAPPERLRLLGLPVRCRRLWLSVDEPEALLRALVPAPA